MFRAVISNSGLCVELEMDWKSCITIKTDNSSFPPSSGIENIRSNIAKAEISFRIP